MSNAGCVTLSIARTFQQTAGVCEVTLVIWTGPSQSSICPVQVEETLASGLVGSSRGDSEDRDVCVEAMEFVEATYFEQGRTWHMNVHTAHLHQSIGSTCALIVGLLLILPGTNALALTSEFGGVELIVTNQSGTRVPSVNLCLAMPGQSVQKVTPSSGSFKATLPIGETTIHVSRDGNANVQDTVSMTNGVGWNESTDSAP